MEKGITTHICDYSTGKIGFCFFGKRHLEYLKFLKSRFPTVKAAFLYVMIVLYGCEGEYSAKTLRA